MRTDKLERNDLSADAFDWYKRYLGALDAKDLEAYSAFLADDCIMYMNNDGPIEGKEAMRAMLGPYWQSIGDLEHDLLVILGSDDHFMLEALNHYTSGGETTTLRAVAVTKRNAAGLASAVRIYTDVSPLFSGGSD